MTVQSENALTIVQLNDSHAYFDLHQEMFWQGDHAVYRRAGGYARISTLVKQMRAEKQGRLLFCDCGDTFHGTYPALQTHGEALILILNSLGLDAMTAHWEFAYGLSTFRQRAAELGYPPRSLMFCALGKGWTRSFSSRTSGFPRT